MVKTLATIGYADNIVHVVRPKIMKVPNASPPKENISDNRNETQIPLVGENTQRLWIEKLMSIPMEVLIILARAGRINGTSELYSKKSVAVASTDDVKNLTIFTIFRQDGIIFFAISFFIMHH